VIAPGEIPFERRYSSRVRVFLCADVLEPLTSEFLLRLLLYLPRLKLIRLEKIAEQNVNC